MGSSKNRFKEFAVAFWKTAKYDLARAEDSFKEKAYSYAVFHSQQCTEKIVKAVLEMEEIFIRDHDVSDLFTIYILKKEKDKKWKNEFYQVLDNLDWFRGTWNITRYPYLKDGKVVSPVESYEKKDAKEALEKSRYTFYILTKFLKEIYKVDVEQ